MLGLSNTCLGDSAETKPDRQTDASIAWSECDKLERTKQQLGATAAHEPRCSVCSGPLARWRQKPCDGAALWALPASALMVLPGVSPVLLELLELISVGRAHRLSDVTEPVGSAASVRAGPGETLATRTSAAKVAPKSPDTGPAGIETPETSPSDRTVS